MIGTAPIFANTVTVCTLSPCLKIESQNLLATHSSQDSMTYTDL